MSAATSLRGRLLAGSVRVGGCRIWAKAKTPSGYGRIKTGGKTKRAHRVSYELNVGPVPLGMHIHHTCHNRACIEPSHLEAVTPKQNSQARAGAPGDSTTGVRGVQWVEKRAHYRVIIVLDGRQHYGGAYDNLADAEAAAIAKRIELGFHGEALPSNV